MKKFKLLLINLGLFFSPLTWYLIFKKILFFVYQYSYPYHKIKNISSCIIHPSVSIKDPENIRMGKNIRIQNNCILWAGVGKIHIGNNTGMGPGTFIFGSNHGMKPGVLYINQQSTPKTVYIGENVWIGSNCVILPGVTIGNNSVIGAGSVVTKSIPENAIALGNPAKVVRFK
ncbi:hypothetical protein ABE41_018265 [Fictibacillus arsenicus]|uniref:Transferase n=1 Tax=Fictibacillus arsenicus TaxID=255247 RepID=A0A1B1Z988_9BACL|nr:acyltransferase [Fictibacillus arsenicus]ANX13961.1 hypothetical protein ABE41_018265 [Fictibacillus arsenicus]